MRIKIAICDDEHNYVLETANLINHYSKENRLDIVIREFSSGEELLASDEQFDLVFLDILMNEINGIDVAKILRSKDSLLIIIFLTNHTEYTKDAFSVHAYEYIEKPISENKLYKQLDSVRTYLSKINENKKILSQKLCFTTKSSEYVVKVEDIYYCEVVNRKIKLVTKQGNFELNDSITNINRKLEKYDFEMPHQSFVVNLYHVINIVKDTIVLENSDSIPLARKRTSLFKKKLHSYLQSKK